MTQHASLTLERWARFSLDQQVLMIANEMHRTTPLHESDDRGARERAYERVLRLVDLTVAAQPSRTLRRELLRWRDLAAALFVRPDARPTEHRAALRVLLQLRPAAARQIPFLLG